MGQSVLIWVRAKRDIMGKGHLVLSSSTLTLLTVTITYWPAVRPLGFNL